MQIKTNDGERSVTGQGQGALNTVLGAIGTAGALMGGGSLLGGLGNANAMNNNPDGRFITKAELDLTMENTTLKSELALQKSENYTDKKLVEVTTYLDGKISRLGDKVDANKDAQQAVNAQQMAYNAAANANIDVLKSQVAALTSVTKIYVPSTNVCQTGCGCGCNQ